ncbi:zinc finger CCCH domain-containing protein 7-like [Trifolium pratense]|uniref:zinc finger CCCH domain-containing protein 7-like n=1 Tax=Trifolium pratense TaxID=57577 RepID=UPI001E693C4E|nr:zinc finger CCCH domain-containing protein 7-like [Trifolium pratense]
MPDCSYFLQGLYSNESCPYRHVSVNPKASICKGFLKGYCADGNEEPLKKVDFTYMNSIMAMMKDPEVDKAFGWVLEM